MSAIQYVYKGHDKRVQHMSKGNGYKSWPLWVSQLVCGLLVSDAPPISIIKAITIFHDTINRERSSDVPCLHYIRHCQAYLQVVGEIMVAIKLGRFPKWVQVGTDATTRGRIGFQCLIVYVMLPNMVIDPIIVLSCIYLNNETADKTEEGELLLLCNLNL